MKQREVDPLAYGFLAGLATIALTSMALRLNRTCGAATANAIPYQLLLALLAGGMTALISAGPANHFSSLHRKVLDKIWREEPVLAEMTGVTLAGGNLPGLQPETASMHLVLTDRSLIILDAAFQEIRKLPRGTIAVREPSPADLTAIPIWTSVKLEEGVSFFLIRSESGSLLFSGTEKDNGFLSALNART